MQIVLVEPLIPQNTGSIARTCAATDTPLHLVGPLGFEITEKAVRRAGLDYWPNVKLTHHTSWDEYEKKAAPGRLWFFENFGDRVYTSAEFAPDDALVFGKETTGLSKGLLARYPASNVLRIPIVTDHVRSLNLSNSVAIALYEAYRQLGFHHQRDPANATTT